MINGIKIIVIFGSIFLSVIMSVIKGKYIRKITMTLVLLTIVISTAMGFTITKVNVGQHYIMINSFTLILTIYLLSICRRKNICGFSCGSPCGSSCGSSCGFPCGFSCNSSCNSSAGKSYKFMAIILWIINIYILFQPLMLEVYNSNTYASIFLISLNTLLLLYFFYELYKYGFQISVVINVVSFFSLMNSILGILQYKTGEILINLNEEEMLGGYSTVKRVCGFVGGDNGAGNLGAIFLPVLLYKYNNKKNAINLCLVILDIIFTILTFTRIGYLAVLIEIIIYICINTNFSAYKDVFVNTSKIFFGVCVFLYIYFNFYNKIYNVLFIQRGNTENERLIQFPKAIKAFISTPMLGTGAGQYNDYLSYKVGVFDYFVIHSQLLNFLVEEGIIVFIIFIIFNIYLILKLLKKYKHKSERSLIVMLFVGNLISTNFNPNQYYDINIYLYYIILFALLGAAGR